MRWAAVAFVAFVLFGVTQGAAAATPGPPGHGEWWFDAWHVQSLWDQGARGQGIVIGEIDTGVNAKLPELTGNILRGKDFGDGSGDGRVDRDGDPFGHGTAMASLMVARSGQDDILGIAPDARVLPIALPIIGTTDADGPVAGGELLEAIKWAADHGAKIISMSLGAPRDGKAFSRPCPQSEQQAIDYALEKGAIVVASGGNSGTSGSPIEEPSVCLGVVSVGAEDSNHAVPPWSSRHPYLTVAAPGVNVPTIGRIPGQAFYGDGTSQAAAITSAGLAMIWSKYPNLTARQVVTRLLATVDGGGGHTTSSGYGSIDIGKAVTAPVPADATNPVYDAVQPFLARDGAAAATTPAPAIPEPGYHSLPGDYAVATPPGPLTGGPGLAGIITAALGLAAMTALATTATRRRTSQRQS